MSASHWPDANDRQRVRTMQKWRRILDLTLVLLFATSFVVMLMANEDPFLRERFCQLTCAHSQHAKAWNKLFYDIAAASVVSLIFYGLVVRLPDHLKRLRIKKAFAAQYKSFRGDCIAIFLDLADGPYDAQLPQELLRQEEFRKYFGGKRWEAVANKLEGFHLGQLINRIEVFRDEILFVLNNTDVGNDQAFELFQRLTTIVYSMKSVSPDYDGIKPLLQFLWQVLSGWSFVGGYLKSDIVEDMIKAI